MKTYDVTLVCSSSLDTTRKQVEAQSKVHAGVVARRDLPDNWKVLRVDGLPAPPFALPVEVVENRGLFEAQVWSAPGPSGTRDILFQGGKTCAQWIAAAITEKAEREAR